MSESSVGDSQCFSRSASVVTLVRALKQSIFKRAGVSDKHVSINLCGHVESGGTSVCADIFDKLLSCKQSQYADHSSWDKNESLRHFASLNFVFRRHRHFLRANRLEMLEKTLRESQTVALPLDPSSMVFSQRTPRAFAYLEHFRLLALLLELANEADWMPLSWEACEGTSHIFPYDDISAVEGPGHPSFLVKQTFNQHEHSLNAALFSIAPTGSLDSSAGFSSLFGALPQQPLPLNALDVFFALPALPPPPDSVNSLPTLAARSSSHTASLVDNNPIDFITVHIDRTQKAKQSSTNNSSLATKAKAFNVMGLATRHQQQRQGEASAEYRATEDCKKDWRELRDTWLRKSQAYRATSKVQETLPAEQGQPSVVPDAPAWDHRYEPRSLSFQESYSKHSTHIHRNSLKQEQVLVRDILLCLQGVPSNSFRYDDHLLQFVPIPSRTHNTGVESLAGLLHSIAHVGTVYRSLEVCASELSKDPSLAGLISQSFALALLETLRHYRHSVLGCLPSCAQRRTAEGSHNNNKEGSLLEVVLHSRRLTSQLCFLGGLAQIDVHNRGNYLSGLPQGADLLSHLYACGVMSYLEATNAPLLRFLFQRSFTAYLRILSEWMYRGQLIDPFNEFFVMRSEGDGDLMYEERKDVSLPIFLRTLQRLIFKCGWSLSILNKASQPHFRAVSVDAPHSPIRLCFSLKDAETLKNECDALMSEQHRKLALLDGEQLTASTSISTSSSLSGATSSPTKSIPASPLKRLSVVGREDDSNGDRKTELPTISRSNTPEITTVRVKLFDSAFSSLSSSTSSASHSASSANARELWQKQRQKLIPLRKEIRQTLSREWQAALLLGVDFQDISGVPAKTRRNSHDSTTGRRNSHDLTVARRNSHDSTHDKSKLVAELSKDGQRGISNLGVTGIRCSSCGSSNGVRRGSNGRVGSHGNSGGNSSNSTANGSSVSPDVGESKEKQPGHVSAVARSLGLSSEVAPLNPFQNTLDETKRITSTDNQVGAAAALARSLGILTGAIPANPFRKRSDSIGSGTTNNSATVGYVSTTSASTTITPTMPNTLTTTNATTSTVTITTTANERRNSVAPPPPPPPSSCATQDKKASGSDENIPVLMSVIINKSLVQVLRSQCRMVDRATRHFFLHWLKVESHCAAIRKYLLMGAGDFSDVLSATLLEGVARVPPVNWTAKANLRACLDYSLRQCGYHSDPLSSHLLLIYNEKADVTRATTVTSQSIEALNSISLAYTTEWPLGLVLTPRSLEAFSSAFTFFVRMKRAAKALTDVWSMHKDKEDDEDKEDEDIEKNVVAEKPPETTMGKAPAPKPRPSVVPPLDKHTRSVHTTRFRMMYVVSGISRYVGTHVQDVLWAEFITQLKAAESLDQLRHCHDQYAERVLSSCFLTGGTVEACFRAVFQAALDFTEVVSNMPMRSHSAAQNQAFQSSIADFNLAVSRLHTVLKSDANAADLLGLLDLDLFDALRT